jgi:hypothetical protein
MDAWMLAADVLVTKVAPQSKPGVLQCFKGGKMQRLGLQVG